MMIFLWFYIVGNVEWVEMIYGLVDEDVDGVFDFIDNCLFVVNSD